MLQPYSLVLFGVLGMSLAALAAPALALAAPARAAPAALADLPTSFAGTLPCADCAGIDWQLDILADGSFQLRRTYQVEAPGNTEDTIGRWVVGSDQTSLALQANGSPPLFLAIENEAQLVLLDSEARPIDASADHRLTAAELPLLEPELGMRGLYRYMADAARFTECTTGRSLPVAFTEDNLTLERAYLDARVEHDLEPGGEILAELRGRIALLPPMEGDGLVPQLEPVAFKALHPGDTCPEPFTQADLKETIWVLSSLAGEPVDAGEAQNRPNLTFFADQPRFAGFGGCNRLIGGYATYGDQLRFAAVAGTLMACVEGMELEAELIKTLAATNRFRILGHMLDLYDLEGGHLARFTVGTPD